jgi:hypothetical protein
MQTRSHGVGPPERAVDGDQAAALEPNPPVGFVLTKPNIWSPCRRWVRFHETCILGSRQLLGFVSTKPTMSAHWVRFHKIQQCGTGRPSVPKPRPRTAGQRQKLVVLEGSMLSHQARLECPGWRVVLPPRLSGRPAAAACDCSRGRLETRPCGEELAARSRTLVSQCQTAQLKQVRLI